MARSSDSRRLGSAVLLAAVLALTACQPVGGDNAAAPPATTVSSTAPSTAPPSAPASTAGPSSTASTTPKPPDKPAKKAAKKPAKKSEKKRSPRLVPGRTIMKVGSTGDRVRDLQARLKQIGWFSDNVTGTYGSVTAASVRGFQAKRQIPVTGAVDQRTLDRLRGMTRYPTSDELHNRLPKPSAAGLDRRCLSGRAMCINKSKRSLVWVVDGKARVRMDVRFGSYETPTRNGAFRVGWKSRHHVSTIYHTPMPYAMFFSGGQAVHYSADFAARGYAGASHGCVNVRNLPALQTLWNQVRVGDKVIVY